MRQMLRNFSTPSKLEKNARHSLTILVTTVLLILSTPSFAITSETFLALPGEKRTEVFKETPEWKKYGPLVEQIGHREGLSDWGLNIWMTIVWNESRFKPDSRGDNGCARGLGQIHAGGQTWRIVETPRSVKKRCPAAKGYHTICPSIHPKDGGEWMPSESGLVYECNVDARKILPTKHPVYGDMRKLSTVDFMDPEIGATASAWLFHQRIQWLTSPFDAATSYAGCETAGGKCANTILNRLKWWWDTGLAKAITKIEASKVATLP